MRLRSALASAVLALAAPTATLAQNSFVRHTAVPPSKDTLDRLNLKTEWGVYLPIEGVRDSVSLVELVDDKQIFVQTKGGTVLALDAKTGQRQWSFSMPNQFTDAYPVAVNSRMVFVVNLSTLYAFDRYTGLLEFAFEPSLKIELPMHTITSGPACDEQHLYLTLGHRHVVAFQIPDSVIMPDAKQNADSKQGGRAGVAAKTDNKQINPTEALAKRYPGRANSVVQADMPAPIRKVNLSISGSVGVQKTPSISVLPTIVPPYSLRDEKGAYYTNTPSLSTLPSMRIPYVLRDGEGRNITKTPSMSVIPPSAARVYELNDIRPKGLTPAIRWDYVPAESATFVPLIANNRLWITTTGRHLVAVDRLDMTTITRSVQADSILNDSVASQPALDGEIGYYPIADGSLLAVELTHGGGGIRTAVRLAWRSNIGGAMNRMPVVSTDGVYVGGAGTGIARVDRTTGDVVWRSSPEDDILVAVNNEYVYTKDAKGMMHVYDRSRVSDTVTKRSTPLASINLEGFGVRITNKVNDRILLASDNGLLVSLRDAAPKYSSPNPLVKAKAKPTEPKKEADAAKAPEAPAANPMEKPADAPKDEKKDEKKEEKKS